MTQQRAASDGAARAAALDASRSFVVQAPAGSGKTELLIQRYLALLSRVDRPESIVAMTFTRKAADEIRERVISSLRAAALAAPAEAHDAQTWRLAQAVLQRDAAMEWNLIAHPARLQVQTIDALCASLMRRAPLTLKVGTLPRFVDRAMPIYLEAARLELEAAAAGDAAWRRLLDHLDNDADRLLELIAGMLAKRDQWLQFLIVNDKEAMRVHLESALAAEIDRELRLVDARVPREAVAPLLDLARYAAGNLRQEAPDHPLAAWLERDRSPITDRGIPGWPTLADWVLSKKGAFLGRLTKTHGFPAPTAAKGKERDQRQARKQAMEKLLTELQQVPGLAAALHSTRDLPPPRYDDASWSFIVALLDVLRSAVARLQLVFARENAIDYPESTLIALRALSSDDAPSDLLLALDMRIEHLLVDEFQDTSLAQYELIERLTEGWTPGDGRTLFVVGDPMQSIYRFREADVSLFLAAQANRRIGGVALEPLTLTRNFRSTKALVDWVNNAFSSVFSSPEHPAQGVVAFKPSAAAREGKSAAPVTVDLCADAREEAAVVVSRVEAALSIPSQTIAILVRKRSDLDALLPALRASDIAFSAVELDQLSERQTVLDLCSLTHALIQPGDRLAWLAILRAPWCGLGLPDLFVIAEHCRNRAFSECLSGDLRDAVMENLSADGRLRFVRLADVAAPFIAERGRQPLATAVRGAWLALGGPACIGDAVDLEASERFFALLGEHQVGADVPQWAMFTEALSALRAEADADPSTRLQIMTLHRAKGLEFDAVIMPGLTRRARHNDRQLLLWRRRSHGLLLAPIKSRYLARGDDDPVYSYLRGLATREELAELGRLLYVGCTRARERLHLTSTLEAIDDAKVPRRWKQPSPRSALGTLWPAIAGSVAPPRPPAAPPGIDARREQSGVPLLRLPSVWRLPEMPVTVPAAGTFESASDRDPVEFDWARETARRIGTVAHRLFRQLSDEGIERWTAERSGIERKRVARELASLGLTVTEVDAAVEQVIAAISTTLDDPRGRWLFSTDHTEARSEFALTGLHGGKFAHLVLDRTFVADGVRWIVDFKLSRHEGGAVQAFLDREQERYRGQLEEYAAVMRAIDVRPIRVGLYFPLLPGWREWGIVS
jgi:ATP-dependent helicase/nuclease subunit A